MSRTDAHVPLWVRERRREEWTLNFTAYHRHERGVCDFEAVLTDPDCWTTRSCSMHYTGIAHICGCGMCQNQAGRHKNVRAERGRWRKARGTLLSDPYADDYIRPARRTW